MNEWKTKRGEEVITVRLEEMDNDYLQKAYIVVEKRQLRLLNNMNTNRRLKKEIEKEAKRRKLQIQSIVETATGKFKKELEKKQPLVLAANNSIARKEKALLNGK